jgi:hypothetical protein
VDRKSSGRVLSKRSDDDQEMKIRCPASGSWIITSTIDQRPAMTTMAVAARVAAVLRQPWRHATCQSRRASNVSSSSSSDQWRLSLAILLAAAATSSTTPTSNDKNGRSLTTQQYRTWGEPHSGASVDNVIMHLQLLHQYQYQPEQEHGRHKVQCERHRQPPPHRRIGEETLPLPSIEDRNALLHQWQEPLIAQSFFSPLLNHRHRQSKHQNKSTTPTSATTTTSTTSIPQSMEEMNRKYKIDYNTVLGEGSYGIVHPAHIIIAQQQQHQDQGDNMISVEAADVDGGRTGVALKIISKSKMLKSSTSTSEIDALLRIFDCGGHPNISGLRDIYEDEKNYYLFLDLARG